MHCFNSQCSLKCSAAYSKLFIDDSTSFGGKKHVLPKPGRCSSLASAFKGGRGTFPAAHQAVLLIPGNA